MISYLRGKIHSVGTQTFIIDVNGVGYKVFAPTALLSSLISGSDFEVYTYYRGREDGVDLFGFPDQETLTFFEKLISISGIGPKTALGVLSAVSLDQLQQALLDGDLNSLTKVSGIGKKTAERIMLELQGKLIVSSSGSSISDLEVLEALEGLGYSTSDARSAVSKIPSDVVGTQNRLKMALSLLAK